MKRSLVAALIIGVLAAAIVIGLHAAGALRPVENALTNAVPGVDATTSPVGPFVQYPLVALLAVGVALVVAASSRRSKAGWLIAILALELLGGTAICLLYGRFFQPLPTLLAVLFSFALAKGFLTFVGRSRSRMTRDLFGGRLSDEKLTQITAGELSYEPEAKSYEATAVVCDIANKHDLAEECSPAELGKITEKFIQHATASFLKAGAYIETVTGEGIVAVFGFPGADEEQAEKATRHALSMLASFEKLRTDGKGSAFSKFSVHFGISSGTMIMTPLEKDDRSELLATGEPVELARRFCIANRFYGSRVLIGPRTFEMASKAIVSRPIDFLSGVDVRERHEIYEPLVLAAEATPEQIARRDSFWNGVVLYREKRWAEAYSQFQKARGPNDLEDAPLQLYVRRIEPLALHLVDSQDE